MPRHTCPVCDCDLEFAPWDGPIASDEICASCGIQFGYNDHRADLRQYVYAEWRAAWVANGRRAFTGPEWHDVATRIVARAELKARAG